MENPAPKDAQRRVSKVPPGSTLDRGMREEKRNDDRSSKGGTLNSGDPEREPEEAEGHLKANCDQHKEDAVWTIRESDSPIVVRDGNSGHTAKGRAGSNANKALTTGHVDPDHCVTLPACNGDQFWHPVMELISYARFLRSPVR